MSHAIAIRFCKFGPIKAKVICVDVVDETPVSEGWTTHGFEKRRPGEEAHNVGSREGGRNVKSRRLEYSTSSMSNEDNILQDSKVELDIKRLKCWKENNVTLSMLQTSAV